MKKLPAHIKTYTIEIIFYNNKEELILTDKMLVFVDNCLERTLKEFNDYYYAYNIEETLNSEIYIVIILKEWYVANNSKLIKRITNR